MEMMKTIQDSRTEFNKEIETWRRTQTEMKMELKIPIIPIIQLENTKTPSIIMTQTVDRISELKNKVDN